MIATPAQLAELSEIERDWSALKGGDGDVFRGGLRRQSDPRHDPGDRAAVGGAGRSEGNPNHDAEGKFASSPGGGKHAAKRARRRKRRQRQLRELHAGYRKDIAELKASHRSDRRELIRDQRGEHKELRREQKKERKALPGELRQARKDLLREQAGERKDLGREQRHEAAATGRRHAKELERHESLHAKRIEKAPAERHEEMHAAHAEERKAIEAEHAEDRAHEAEVHAYDRANMVESHREARGEMKAEHVSARSDLRATQLEERASQRETHRADRASMRESQREERREQLESIRDDLYETHGFRRKGAARGMDSGLQRSARLGAEALAGRHGSPGAQSRRLSPARTLKASSAESILRLVLRRLGLTREWRRGGLTARQALEVLGAVREYAREWLHHEAEQLVKAYGRAIDGSGAGAGDDEGRPRAVHGSPGRLGDSPAPVAGSPSGVGRLGGDPDRDGGRVARSLSDAMRRHVGRFFRRARNFVHEAIVAGVMALSGPEPLGADDLAGVDRHAAEQVAYLDRFEADVSARPPLELAEPSGAALTQPMTAAEFAARAELYGNSPWVGALNLKRQKAILSGRYAEERRLHYRPPGVDHPCATCAGESAKGWVPIGTLKPIGDSECLGNLCDCFYEFRARAA